MKRAAFTFLCIHAHILATSGLEQLAAELPAAGGDDFARLSADEREELAIARMSNMDMSSMTGGFGWETAAHDDLVRDNVRQLQDVQRAGPAVETPVATASAGTDLASSLAHAYAASARTASQVDRLIAAADMAVLDSLAAALPGDLPPLTEALDADGLGRWLARYRAGDETLQTLVTLCVQPDSAAGTEPR